MLFGNIFFKNNIVTLLIDLMKILWETNAICVNIEVSNFFEFE